MECDDNVVVIENGSKFIKAGLAGDDAPRVVFISMIGVPKPIPMGRDQKPFYVGYEAYKMRGVLRTKYPIENGIITDFNDMENIWQHTFENELKVDPSKCPVLLTEPPLNPRVCREKTAQIMFETFQVPSLCLANQSALAGYASGRETCIVVDSGSNVTHFVPIFEGFAVSHATRHLNLGGDDLTKYLRKLLNESGYHDMDIFDVQRIKENETYIAYNFEHESLAVEDKTYELLDGNLISVKQERIKCPEALFRPPLLGMEVGGIHTFVEEAIQTCDEDIKKILYGNIVISGGNSMFPGIAERLTKEMLAYTSHPKVVAAPERKYSTWIGGSIIGSLSNYQDYFISKEEYNECGPNVVNKKCF